MVTEERTIADALTCRICQGMADGVTHYKLKRSFTTTLPGRTSPVIWRPPLVCPVQIKPLRPGLMGEFNYTDHALLLHPEVRGAHIRLCLVQAKVEPSRGGRLGSTEGA